MKIVVLGTGYVGLVSGACFADIGHSVVCVDTDKKKVDLVNSGKSPIYEDGLDDILQRVIRSGNLQCTSDLDSAMVGAEVTFIAVGTPFVDNVIDLKYIKQATKDIAKAVKFAAEYHVVCVKSTVVPGTTKNIVGTILEKYSDRRIGVDLGLAMNPEFLAEGSAVADFSNPDRIVIGSNNNQAGQTIKDLYAPFIGTDVLLTGLSTAEMTKYTANAFLASVISFSNEIANLCSKIDGVDIIDVMKGVHLDRRLSPVIDSNRIKPGLMAFLHPGTGFGGSCFPKDINALISFSNEMECPMPILTSVIETNLHQPEVTVKMVEDELGCLVDKKVVVLGLAFKPGTDDIRESPALKVIKSLLAKGAEVTAHDPVALDNMQKEYVNPKLYYCRDHISAIEGADIIVLLTSWSEYDSLHELLKHRNIPVMDGRRALNKSNFDRYIGIGLN